MIVLPVKCFLQTSRDMHGNEMYLTDLFVFYKKFLVDVLFDDMKKTKVCFM